MRAKENGINVEGGYAQVGGGSASGTQGVKRKAEGAGDEERPSDDRPRGGGVDVDQVTVDLANEWLPEIKVEVRKKLEGEEEFARGQVERAWDDVNEGWELPVAKVREARAEEVAYFR